jgi:hypothetical protein
MGGLQVRIKTTQALHRVAQPVVLLSHIYVKGAAARAARMHVRYSMQLHVTGHNLVIRASLVFARSSPLFTFAIFCRSLPRLFSWQFPSDICTSCSFACLVRGGFSRVSSFSPSFYLFSFFSISSSSGLFVSTLPCPETIKIEKGAGQWRWLLPGFVYQNREKRVGPT